MEYSFSDGKDLSFGRTPLHLAAQAGRKEEVISILSQNPELIDRVDTQNRSVLHYAASGGHADVVEYLLAQRPNLVNLEALGDWNVLQAAAQAGSAKVAEQILALKPELIDRADSWGRTSLHLAAQAGFDDLVMVLLAQRPAQLDIADAWGSTALHHASQHGHIQIVKRLLAQGSRSIDAANYSNGDTPMQCAVTNKHEEVIEVLLANTPTLAKNVDNRRSTLLHNILGDAEHEFSLTLLEQVWSLNPEAVQVKDVMGSTPFDLALPRYGKVQKRAASFLQRKVSIGQLLGAFGEAALTAPLGAKPQDAKEELLVQVHFKPQDAREELLLEVRPLVEQQIMELRDALIPEVIHIVFEYLHEPK